MAYPSANWQHFGPQLGLQPIAQASLVQQHPLGLLAWAQDATYGEAAFLYLRGASSTAAGDVVVYSTATGTTTRALQGTNTSGAIAIAMSACTAGLYGWYQVTGAGPARAGSVVAGNNASLSSTAGQLDDNGNNTLLAGLVVASGDVGGFATVQLSHPSISPAPTGVFSIRAEGALGDGVTDDSAAFVAAEAKAYASGGVVSVPPGTFLVTNLTTRVGVQGTGTLKHKAASTAPLLTLSADNLSVEGVTLDGNKANQTYTISNADAGAYTLALVSAVGASNVLLRGVRFLRNYHVCVHWTPTGGLPVKGLSVVGCTFRDGIWSAIWAFGDTPASGVATLTSGGLVVVGNYFENMGSLVTGQTTFYGDVCHLGWLASATIANNIYETGGRCAIKAGTVKNLKICDNQFRNIFWHGVQISPGSTDATAQDFDSVVAIERNTFDGCSNADSNNATTTGGILCNGSTTGKAWLGRHLIVKDNVVRNCPSSGASTRDGIYVDYNARYRQIEVSGNKVSMAARHGIYVAIDDTAKTTHLTVENNKVDCTGYQISGSACIRAETITSPMTSANRLVTADFEGNKCMGGFYGLNLVGDVARNVDVQGNRFIGTAAEGLYWAETVTPLSVWVDNNRWLETSVAAMAYLPNVSNVWLGKSNRGLTAQGFIHASGTAPVGLGVSTLAPTFGWWRKNQEIETPSPASGGYRGYVCTTAGWATDTAWASTTAYAVGAFVYNGTNVYQVASVTGDALSAGSGGPTGTGTGITDNHVTWNYLAPLAVFKTYGAIS